MADVPVHQAINRVGFTDATCPRRRRAEDHRADTEVAEDVVDLAPAPLLVVDVVTTASSSRNVPRLSTHIEMDAERAEQ